jgi:predicted ATPase
MNDSPLVPQLEELWVSNYRALQSVKILGLTPMTVLVGPNGSGKSTVFDVFSFLSEAFQFGLRQAWDRRGRARELKTRGQNGPVTIALYYRERSGDGLNAYQLQVDEENGSPVVIYEELVVCSDEGDVSKIEYHYSRGQGNWFSRDASGRESKRIDIPLRSPDLLAVSAIGQLAEHPRVAALREFIIDWHISYLSIADTHNLPEAGAEEHLNRTGDNLAKVIQFLSRQHPDMLDRIFEILARRVPRLEKVLAEETADGRLLLRIKDAPFNDPILARFASDGTLKLLAYLVLLHDPAPPKLIGIEEPENLLHPRLMYSLAEDFRGASERSQLLVTTHSPYFLNALRPEEVRVLYRDERGFTQTQRAADLHGVREFMEHGGQLGDLWMEGHFNVGDPLSNSGMPRLANGL